MTLYYAYVGWEMIIFIWINYWYYSCMQCMVGKYCTYILYIYMHSTVNAHVLHSLLFSSDALNTPSLTQISLTNSTLIYGIARNNQGTGPLIAGYEVTRFGVPMIGEYVNADTQKKVTISPAVPGAQYRITAWALGSDRSATPAVVDVTTGEASKTVVHME